MSLSPHWYWHQCLQLSQEPGSNDCQQNCRQVWCLEGKPNTAIRASLLSLKQVQQSVVPAALKRTKIIKRKTIKWDLKRTKEPSVALKELRYGRCSLQCFIFISTLFNRHHVQQNNLLREKMSQVSRWHHVNRATVHTRFQILRKLSPELWYRPFTLRSSRSL